MNIYRGTTPPIKLEFPDTDPSFLLYDKLIVTIAQGNLELDIEGDELTVSAHKIEFTLTQKQTLSLRPNMSAYVQVNSLTPQGKRPCSIIGEFLVLDNLLNKVI